MCRRSCAAEAMAFLPWRALAHNGLTAEGGSARAAGRLTSSRTDAEDHAGALISHRSRVHGRAGLRPPRCHTAGRPRLGARRGELTVVLNQLADEGSSGGHAHRADTRPRTEMEALVDSG